MTPSKAFIALEKESMGFRLRKIVDQLDSLMSALVVADIDYSKKEVLSILKNVEHALEIYDAIEASVKMATSTPTAG